MNIDISNVDDFFSKKNILSYSSNRYIDIFLKIIVTTFIPKRYRTFLVDKIACNKSNSVRKIWSKFIQLYFLNQLDKFEIKPKKEFSHSKIIWQYWGQGVDSSTLPDVVKICFKSVDLYRGEYHVIRLDDNNIKDYLDLPDFIDQKRLNPEFKHVFFSDILRLALLNAYGGVWVDATILLTAPIDPQILKQDFFLFQRDSQVSDKEKWLNFNKNYFGWEKHHINILNSFIVSTKNNQITHICLDLMLNFWKTQNCVPHYFFFQIMFDVLKKDFLKLDHLYLLDDTLPHLIQINFNQKFNIQTYQKILNKVNIHKLTYVNIQDEQTYYGFIKNHFLGKGIANKISFF